MGRWLFEDGIGERRAALVERGRIVEARIERDSDGQKAGGLLFGRLLSKRDRIARLDVGEEVVVVGALPNEGEHQLFEITRSALPERDLVKRARARAVWDDPRELVVGPNMALLDAIEYRGGTVRTVRPGDADLLEDAGWSECIEAARTGILPFDGGVLRLALTPAMAVFDVDGDGTTYALAIAGAKAAGRACRLLGIGGNIAVDLPSVRQRDKRDAIRAGFVAALADADPRTACLPIDALGLLHVTRPRFSASIAERVQFASVETAALLLLRRAERARGHGPLDIVAHPLVAGWLGARPPLLEMLARRVGRLPALRADATRPIWGGDAQ